MKKLAFLTASQLQDSAKASEGMRPHRVSAYPWDGEVRYCVVWQADKSDKKPKAK